MHLLFHALTAQHQGSAV